MFESLSAMMILVFLAKMVMHVTATAVTRDASRTACGASTATVCKVVLIAGACYEVHIGILFRFLTY
jgi:hypothetical protein